MKSKLKIFASIACASVCALSIAGCGGKSTLLGKPVSVTDVTYAEREKEGYNGLVTAVDDFSASFAEYAYADYKKENNFTVSPVSVYMALSLAAECANGQTREEILNALGVTYEQLYEFFPTLYGSLEVEHKRQNTVTGLLDLSNSIWINEGTAVKQACIDKLSKNFYSYSYSADFANDNAAANKAVRDFVKENTRGLIDKDFHLPEITLFTLINTLYLNTVWNEHGFDLEYTDGNYDFKNSDGTITSTKLLNGYYNRGRVYSDDGFNAFYTTTSDGYKLKFIAPKEGFTVDDIFTAENLVKVNSVTDYNSVDEKAEKEYFTRCIFPEFNANYDEDVKKILQDKFGVKSFFNDACDLSNLTDAPAKCTSVRHVTELKVDKHGIEGAAVTVAATDGSAGPRYEQVYCDFIIDGAFGFIITDSRDVTLFSGVVQKI